MGVIAVFDPLLLHEFELPEDAGVYGHEDDAAVVGIAHRLPLRHVLAIRQATPHNTAPVHQATVKSECIARVGTPNVGANGAPESAGVAAVCEIRILLVVRDDARIGLVWRKLDRRTIAPAAHKLGREFFLAARILRSL